MLAAGRVRIDRPGGRSSQPVSVQSPAAPMNVAQICLPGPPSPGTSQKPTAEETAAGRSLLVGMAVTSPTFQIELLHLDVAFVPADRVVAVPGQVRGLAHGADIPAEDGTRALSAAAAAPVAQIGKRPQHQAGESDDRPVHHPLPVAQGVRSWRSRGSQNVR